MTGRLALVTGGSGGIGRAVATGLHQSGCRVLATDRKPPDWELPPGIAFAQADLSSAEECRQIVQHAIDQFGGVDILVNNAGYQHVEPIESFPTRTWDDMLAVMLTAPFLLTRYCWPGMKARKYGRIVNMASIHGLVASPYKSAYVAAKHGLLGLTRTAALEGGEYGITVNALCPAYVRTALVEGQLADQARLRGMTEAQVLDSIMLAPAAIKRLIEPEELADLVVFLCSAAGSAVTGAAWTIDLGWTAR